MQASVSNPFSKPLDWDDAQPFKPWLRPDGDTLGHTMRRLVRQRTYGLLCSR